MSFPYSIPLAPLLGFTLSKGSGSNFSLQLSTFAPYFTTFEGDQPKWEMHGKSKKKISHLKKLQNQNEKGTTALVIYFELSEVKQTYKYHLLLQIQSWALLTFRLQSPILLLINVNIQPTRDVFLV